MAKVYPWSGIDADFPRPGVDARFPSPGVDLLFPPAGYTPGLPTEPGDGGGDGDGDGPFVPAVLRITGLASGGGYSGFVRVGSEAGVGVDAGDREITYVSWGDDGSLGTGPHPQDTSPLDTGDYANPGVLTVTAVVDGVEYSTSAPVRRAPPVKTGEIDVEAEYPVGATAPGLGLSGIVEGEGLTARVVLGPLPPGIALVDNDLAGTFTTPVERPVTIEVFNSGGRVFFGVVFEVVNRGGPSLSGIALDDITLIRSSETVQIETAQAFTDDAESYGFEDDASYAGLAIDPETGSISADLNEPGLLGEVEVRVVARNAFGVSPPATFTLTISEDEIPLAYKGPDPLEIAYVIGSNPVYRAARLFEGGDTDLLVYSTPDAPEGWSIDAAGDIRFVAPVTITLAIEGTTPIDVSSGRTDFTVDATGTLWAVLTGSATQPTGAQIKDGLDHTGAAALKAQSMPVTVAGPQGLISNGLDEDTTYHVHLYFENGDGVPATVESTTLTTPAAGAGSASDIYPAELSYDGVPFDSGFAIGEREAQVYEHGTAGAALEGRILQAKTQIAGVTAWVDVGPVSNGQWAGWIGYEYRLALYVREFRVKGGDTSTKTMANRIKTSHLALSVTQSDVYKSFYWGGHATTPKAPTVNYPDAILMGAMPRSQNAEEPYPAGYAKLLNGDPANWVNRFSQSTTLVGLPAGVAMLANSIGADGKHYCWVQDTVTGTGLYATVHDGYKRWPADGKQIAETLITDPEFGQRFGVLAFFISSGTGTTHTDPSFFGPAVFGKNLDGSNYTPGSRGIDQSLADYPGVDFDNHTKFAAILWGDEAKLQDVLTMQASPVFGQYFAPNWQTMTPLAGYLPYSGHPDQRTLDGGAASAIQHVAWLMYVNGVFGQGEATPTMIEFAPGGDNRYVRIGLSWADMTTGYFAMGHERSGSNPDVYGFKFNGVHLTGDACRFRDENKQIVKRGDLWLRKPDGSAITQSDRAKFDYTADTGSYGSLTRMMGLAAAPGDNGLFFSLYNRLKKVDLFSNPSKYPWRPR